MIGLSKFLGIIVPKGEVFSFNTMVNTHANITAPHTYIVFPSRKRNINYISWFKEYQYSHLRRVYEIYYSSHLWKNTECHNSLPLCKAETLGNCTILTPLAQCSMLLGRCIFLFEKLGKRWEKTGAVTRIYQVMGDFLHAWSLNVNSLVIFFSARE